MLALGFSWTGFYASILLNVPLALLLLWLYRRAVARAMRGSPAQGRSTPPHAVAAPASMAAPGAAEELEVEVIDAAEAAPGPCANGRSPVRAAVVTTAVSGTAFVLIVIVGWYLTLGGRLHALWMLWWIVLHAWPVPLACGLVSGATGSDWVRLAGGYLGAFGAVSAACLATYEDLAIAQIAANAATVLPVAVPAIGLAYRPVRAVGLLVFAFLLTMLALAPPIAMSLLQLLVQALAGESPARWPVALVLALTGVNAIGVIVWLLGLLGGALLGYGALRGVGALYRRKRLSEESLLIDTLWSVIAVSHLLMLSTQAGGAVSWAWAAGPAAALVAYAGLQRGLPKLLHRRELVPGKAAPLLLLLRVFALGQRSQRMFDVLVSRWLRTGPIVFIAGPDLAAGTVQPSQFLEFLAGRLERQFLARAADAARRASELDIERDPDGRYRVNQLYCAGDTWKEAVLALAQRSDAVLMDLRGFSAANRGCLQELELLLGCVPVRRVLLVVDGTTDRPFLDVTLRRLWRASSTRPASWPRAVLRVARISRSAPSEMRAVARLLEAGARAASIR